MLKKAFFNFSNNITLKLIFCFIIAGKSYCSSSSDSSSTNIFDTSGKFRIEAAVFGGFGFNSFEIGKTTENESVTISPGGGLGGKIGLGYCVSSLFNISAEFGAQSSDLSKTLKNAKGSFSRSFLAGLLRYKFPITDISSINIGAGAGYYMSGKLDLNASQIENGAHNIYKYKNTAGIIILCEYELFLPGLNFLNASYSLATSLKYANVNYKLNSVTSNGVNVPISLLTSKTKKDVEKLDGSGIDILISFIMHL